MKGGIMPTYDYKCKECGKVFEVFRRFSELDEEVNCLNCGSEKQRDFSLLLTSKLKPWQALGMEKLNFLQSVQNQAKGWVEEWVEDGGEANQVQVKNHSERRRGSYHANLGMERGS
jgi:putative FmdB family regulatory protein